MIRRTLEISSRACRLAVRDRQLRIRPHATVEGEPPAPEHTVPLEDIGVVIVDEPSTTYTHAVLAGLLEHGAVLIVCNANHMPAGVLLPLPDHGEVVWRISAQLEVSKPRQKQLWQQIVRAKILAQSASLPLDPLGESTRRQLRVLARFVRSGDAANREAQAARAYWRVWLGPSAQESAGSIFRRVPGGGGTNGLLDYGYAVLRAAVARALVAAGLQPALGLHHENRSNAFCLADDLMEPLRPLVDVRVRSLAQRGVASLDRAAKAELLSVLTASVRCPATREASGAGTDETVGPLLVALHRYVASLCRCYSGEQSMLSIPQGEPYTPMPTAREGSAVTDADE